MMRRDTRNHSLISPLGLDHAAVSGSASPRMRCTLSQQRQASESRYIYNYSTLKAYKLFHFIYIYMYFYIQTLAPNIFTLHDCISSCKKKISVLKKIFENVANIKYCFNFLCKQKSNTLRYPCGTIFRCSCLFECASFF